MLVCPMTWTWAISLQLVPITTSRPIMQKGPIVVPSPITAPSSTRAVGSIVVIEGPLSLARIWRKLSDFSVVSASRRDCPVTCHPWSWQAFCASVHGALDKGGALRNHAHIGKGLRVTFGFDVNVDDDRLRLAFPSRQNLGRYGGFPEALKMSPEIFRNSSVPVTMHVLPATAPLFGTTSSVAEAANIV